MHQKLTPVKIKILEQESAKLKKVTEERDHFKAERDRKAAFLHNKLEVMEKSYEGILQDAFDALAKKFQSARQKWDGESKSVERASTQILSEFGKDLWSIL